jgi:DNA-binding FrmR family transcriptional regulator
MRNKQLFLDKMNRIDGKLKTIRVMVTRPHSIQDIHDLIDQIDDQMNDLNTMVEREPNQ